MQKSTSEGYEEKGEIEDRIRRVKTAAGMVSDNIKAAEARLAQFCFEICTFQVFEPRWELTWDPKEKRILAGKTPLRDLPFESRRRAGSEKNLSALIEAAVSFMERNLGL